MKILGWVEVQKLGKVELSSGLGDGVGINFFTRSENMVTIFKVGRSGRGLIGLRLVEELIL